MKKYLSINDFNEGKEMVNHLITMPDNLKTCCRLCSDGPVITLSDKNDSKVYGLYIDVESSKHQLCYDLEETDFARSLERGLMTVFHSALSEFLNSEQTVFNTEEVVEQLQNLTNYFLVQVQDIFNEEREEAEAARKAAKKKRDKKRRYFRRKHQKNQNKN